MSNPPTAPSGLRRMPRTIRATPPGPRAAIDARAALSVPDARIEEAIDQIDSEIQHDDAGRQEQVDALDDGVIAPGDGVEQEPPHAGQDEDTFHDDRAPDEGRELEPHHGDHGNHGVL